MRKLLRSGQVHADYRSAEGETALHAACALPNAPLLEELLSAGGRQAEQRLLSLRDDGGRALLHRAAAAEAHDGPTLARLAAQRHATDGLGWTPLHHAAATGSARTCAWLLRGGGSAAATAVDGRSPLPATLCDPACNPV